MERAKGLLQAQHGGSEPQAYEHLRGSRERFASFVKSPEEVEAEIERGLREE